MRSWRLRSRQGEVHPQRGRHRRHRGLLSILAGCLRERPLLPGRFRAQGNVLGSDIHGGRSTPSHQLPGLPPPAGLQGSQRESLTRGAGGLQGRCRSGRRFQQPGPPPPKVSVTRARLIHRVRGGRGRPRTIGYRCPLLRGRRPAPSDSFDPPGKDDPLVCPACSVLLVAEGPVKVPDLEPPQAEKPPERELRSAPA
jgi:hypothetical protein